MAPGTVGASTERRFDRSLVERLPPPVQRWLCRAIAPGTVLRTHASIVMRGRIKVGHWAPFVARQELFPPSGFVWRAAALVPLGRLPLLPVVGFDRYAGGAGRMRWRALGAIPVVRADGDDVARSAAGRLAAESLLVPAFALTDAVRWTGIDDTRAVAAVTIGGRRHDVDVAISASGALESCTMTRWGDPDGGQFAGHAFGAQFEGEFRAGGYIVPAGARVGWWFGQPRWTDGEFFRFRIGRVTFR